MAKSSDILREVEIEVECEISNFEMLATNVKHIQVKQNRPGARWSWGQWFVPSGQSIKARVWRSSQQQKIRQSRDLARAQVPELRYSNPEGPQEAYQWALDTNNFYVFSFLKANLLLGSRFPRKRNKETWFWCCGFSFKGFMGNVALSDSLHWISIFSLIYWNKFASLVFSDSQDDLFSQIVELNDVSLLMSFIDKMRTF